MLLCLGTPPGPCGNSVTIRDLSLTGLLVETSAELEAGDRFDVELPHVGRTRATVVWHDARLRGCKFERPIPKAALSAALLRGDPSPAPKQATKLRLLLTVAIAASVIAASLAYLVAIGSAVALAVLGILAAIGLLVAWGVWVMNNTVQL